jgi:hypothetical protein
MGFLICYATHTIWLPIYLFLAIRLVLILAAPTVHVHILVQFMILYFSLLVKNKLHGGVAPCAFILELGAVTNRATAQDSAVTA